MTNIINMYFNYIKKCNIIQVDGRKSMIIGICGKSGCGKSTLANQIIELTNNKAIHLDIDKIGHRVLLLPEVQKELIRSFGESVVKENNVDRKKLGEIVFDSRNEMKKLSDITWKYMQIEIDNFLNLHKDKIIILDNENIAFWNEKLSYYIKKDLSYEKFFNKIYPNLQTWQISSLLIFLHKLHPNIPPSLVLSQLTHLPFFP